MDSRRRSSPSSEDDEDGKQRQDHGYKRSRRHDDFSDDERRKRRSTRDGAERRPSRKDTRDDNDKSGCRFSPRKDSPSPDRTDRGSRDRKRHEESRASHRKDRYSPLSETKGEEGHSHGKESHSFLKFRDENRHYSPSSDRRYRDGDSHRRVEERSKVSSRKDDHSSSPDRNHRGHRRAHLGHTISDNEEQISSINDNRASSGDKLYDGHRNAMLHGSAGHRDTNFHGRDDRWMPKEAVAKDLSKTISKYSDDERNIRRSRLHVSGGNNDKKSRNGCDSDRVAKDRSSEHDGKESRHANRDREALQERAVDAPGKGNNSSNNNLPAGDAVLEVPVGRSGGVYIPPFKLAQMMKEIQDKSSVEYQRMTWDALRKSINGLVNKVNASNIKNIIPELLSENLIRGRGLFARSCMKSQLASPLFTNVFAALVAVVNTKFPELGELLLKRVILQFRRALRRNDKPLLLAAARFIAHLVNQQVAHEVVALEVLMVLLENPTDDSVEVAVGFVKECGAILQDLAPQGLHGIFERFRGILHEGEIDKRVQFMIEGLFAIRKVGFQGHPAVIPELDLVEQEEQFTHEISLSGDLDGEMSLDIFKPDENFLENEKKYEGIKRDILGEESSDDDDDGDNGSGLSSEDDEDDEDDEAEMQRMQIKDETETNLVNLRRTIYLTIMSSVDFEEAGHKLLKIKLEPGQEMELNIMLLECCSQERTYLRYYGLLGQRFCMINKIYQENFDICFVKQYSMIHRLETNKLRNVAKFFAHLLGTDALPWNVLGYIKLTEEDTTSSSRIFIKILFQELSEHLGLRKLNEKLNEPGMEECFEGIFPRDNPKNTRFAINFFTSIGLGGITDSLREYLKNMPRLIMQQQRQVESESGSSEAEGTSGSESSSPESESDSESESESESDRDSRRKRKQR